MTNLNDHRPPLMGKRAVITGAASGIGLATATKFVDDGASVALLDVDENALDRACESLPTRFGQNVVGVVCDVSDESSVQRAFQDAVEELGGLDIIVCNAGIQLHGLDSQIHELDKAIWDATLGVNLTGVFLTCKYGLPTLLSQGAGSIILTGSIVGLRGVARNYSAYTASKAGVHGLMRLMANDYGPQGIRVNVVAPGFIDTPLTQSVTSERVAELVDATPLRRQGKPQDPANVIAFLASDDASFVTGSIYVCDGGKTSI